MSDRSSEDRPPQRARRDARAMPDADLRLPERRLRPLDRSRDPFGEQVPTPKQRRIELGERSTAAPRLIVAPLDDPLDPPPVAKHAAVLERELLLDELVAGRPRHTAAPMRPTVRREGFPWLLISICVASLTILLLFWSGESGSPRLCLAPGCVERVGVAPAEVVVPAPQLATPSGQNSVVGTPTMSAQQIDGVLAQWQSPATGTGAAWVSLGQRYGIDPAYALAFFIHESGAGTAPGWAGFKAEGGTTHNVGNIICAGYPTCYGRFRDYGSWEEGIEDWYRLIAVEYINGRGVHTVEEIIPIYAPSFENNVPNYINTVNRLVAEWRASRRG